MVFNLFGGGTIECRACGEEVSVNADVCPHCGENLEEFKLYVFTKECRACGGTLSNDADVCPHCGEDQEGIEFFSSTKECRACGREISTDATECPFCGEDLEEPEFGSSLFNTTSSEPSSQTTDNDATKTETSRTAYCGNNASGYGNSGYLSTSANNYQTGSSSGSGFAGWFILIVIIAIVLTVGYHYFSDSAPDTTPTATYTSPVTPSSAPSQPQAAPPNPFGEGNGQVAFYRVCAFCKVQVFDDTTSVGFIPTPPLLVDPQCTDNYMLRFITAAGTKTFTIKDDDGYTWQQTVQVPNGDCTLTRVDRPETATKPANDTTAQNLPATSDQQAIDETAPTDFHLTSPADHSSFDYPRFTEVAWTNYPGADYYQVELQLSNNPFDYSATSYSPMPYSNQGIYQTAATTVTVQGMGKQVHRVRVKAIKGSSVVSVTPWCYFTYNQ